EQRTENPCVPGSIPGGTTENKRVTKIALFFFMAILGVFSLMFKPCLNQKLSTNHSLSIIYYASKTLKNGNHPIMLRIIQNRQTKYVLS
ncbi:MAG: Arm DNA-binding domain-containing protein, partial [Butyricimonas virosa]